MEYRTWTRKSTAKAAVKKALDKIDLPEDILIKSIDAADIGSDDKPAFAAKVFAELVEGATIANDELNSFKSALGSVAEVEIIVPERRQASGRNSPYRGCKIYVSGGQDAVNPFRPKSKSHAAFDFVKSNPGTRFEDLQSFGVRIRTVTECLRKGFMRSTMS